VNHKSQKTHHGSTALVELDGTLLQLGLFIKGVLSEVNEVVTEVTDEFSSGDSQPEGISENLVPSKEMRPGRRIPAAVTRYPTTPNIQIRPCLIST